MDQFSKEGRKLRPRKSAAGSAAPSERVEYYHDERKSYGEHKSYGESRGSYGGHGRSSYGNNGNGGERRSYGQHRNYGESRNAGNGERRPYGENRSSSYGERRSFGSNGNGGERRSYGEHKSFGESRNAGNGERRTYGESRSSSYGEHKSGFGGPRKSFGENRGNGGGKPFRSGKPFGRKPFGDKEHVFNRQSEEGINRMIDRRPVVNGSEEPVEKFPQMIKDEIRLNKFIANSGVCSRREADTLIQAGVVTVNGEVITELGTKVNIYEDDIRFNGERLKGEEKVYIIMNKPKGFVTTASDPHAEKTVLDLIKECSARVYPVGRLDKNTTGVLMLTNDGEIAERLTHPSYDKKKIYQVALDRALSQEDYDQILSGVVLPDGEVKADELEYIDEGDHRKLGIEIHSGKNRIVRRIFESLGYTVKALDRVYFAGLTKKGLKKGEWRYLTESEAGILKMGSYI